MIRKKIYKLFFAFIVLSCCCFFIYSINEQFNYFNNSFVKLKYSKLVYKSDEEINKDEIFIFLDFVKKVELDVFLIEPKILFNLLTPLKKKYFIKYNINPNSNKSIDKQITFGIKINKNIKQNNDKILNLCMNSNFNAEKLKCIEYYGIDNSEEWHVGNKATNFNKLTLVHYLFKSLKSNQTIHLAIFYQRSEALWVGKIKKSNCAIENEKNNSLIFGNYEELYDDFNLTDIIYLSNLYKIKIPLEFNRFLMQMNNSRLIECDREMANNYYKKLNKKGFYKSKFINESYKLIKSFKMMMDQYLIPYWISSGTLLGWYRQHDIIPYTTDVDFAVDSRFASTNLSESIKKNQYGFKFLYIWGIVEKGLEFTLLRNNYKNDLFFVYPAENDTVTIFIHQVNSYIRLFYPKFDLCAAQFKGMRFNVPCNTRTLLEVEYGKNWVNPVSNWNYMNSSLNKGPLEYWPENSTNLKKFY